MASYQVTLVCPLDEHLRRGKIYLNLVEHNGRLRFDKSRPLSLGNPRKSILMEHLERSRIWGHDYIEAVNGTAVSTIAGFVRQLDRVWTQVHGSQSATNSFPVSIQCRRQGEPSHQKEQLSVICAADNTRITKPTYGNNCFSGTQFAHPAFTGCALGELPVCPFCGQDVQSLLTANPMAEQFANNQDFHDVGLSCVEFDRTTGKITPIYINAQIRIQGRNQDAAAVAAKMTMTHRAFDPQYLSTFVEMTGAILTLQFAQDTETGKWVDICKETNLVPYIKAVKLFERGTELRNRVYADANARYMRNQMIMPIHAPTLHAAEGITLAYTIFVEGSILLVNRQCTMDDASTMIGWKLDCFYTMSKLNCPDPTANVGPTTTAHNKRSASSQ